MPIFVVHGANALGPPAKETRRVDDVRECKRALRDYLCHKNASIEINYEPTKNEAERNLEQQQQQRTRMHAKRRRQLAVR